MFSWLSRVLHWRQGCEAVTQGTQKQFIPYKGVYVLCRQWKGKTVMTVLNGRRSDNELDVRRYAEVIGSHATAQDVTTGATIDLTRNVPLTARQALILTF